MHKVLPFQFCPSNKCWHNTTITTKATDFTPPTNVFNPFVPNKSFLYPLKTSEDRKVF